ncbi:MAG TPA: hypothetical protein VLE43_01810 [Candidatus Saccharimonadia bacterium]|nr:hypothetical protein [Candidatus Saccharimonadia bacterium]
MAGKAPKVILATLLVAAVAIYVLTLPRPAEYPHFTLSDGAEFRVVQITYTAGPSYFPDHNIGASKLRWWLWRHLPKIARTRMNEPDHGISGLSSDRPALSIWWTRIDPGTHQPMLGPAGDVLMTLDSGKVINLGWPEPGVDHRQIFITDPPADSEHLRFEVPVEEEKVSFTIKNPAYRP